MGLLVDCEWTAREQRKLTRRLRSAKPRYKSASLENVEFKHSRGLNRQHVDYIRHDLADLYWFRLKANSTGVYPRNIQ